MFLRRENTFSHHLCNLDSASPLFRDGESVSQDCTMAPPLREDGHVIQEVGGGNMEEFPACLGAGKPGQKCSPPSAFLSRSRRGGDNGRRKEVLDTLALHRYTLQPYLSSK